jgi:hypothetical protein
METEHTLLLKVLSCCKEYYKHICLLKHCKKSPWNVVQPSSLGTQTLLPLYQTHQYLLHDCSNAQCQMNMIIVHLQIWQMDCLKGTFKGNTYRIRRIWCFFVGRENLNGVLFSMYFPSTKTKDHCLICCHYIFNIIGSSTCYILMYVIRLNLAQFPTFSKDLCSPKKVQMPWALPRAITASAIILLCSCHP